MYVNKSDVLITIDLIAKAPFDYIILRNTENELPGHLKKNKDIDILINNADRKKALSYFMENSFFQIVHPWHRVPKIGAITDFDYLINDAKIILDLNYQLVLCNFARTAFKLHDKLLQRSIWEKTYYKYLGDHKVRYIDPDIEFVISFLRCCIDKRKMSHWNFKRLCKLYDNSNDKTALMTSIAPYYPNKLVEIKRMFDTQIWSNNIILS